MQMFLDNISKKFHYNRQIYQMETGWMIEKGAEKSWSRIIFETCL